ncbi:tRNA (guanine-N(1)-)-methyltransferase [compost metagenome]
MSGHHANVATWRRKEALRRTLLRRPDLLDKVELTRQDMKLLNEVRVEVED